MRRTGDSVISGASRDMLAPLIRKQGRRIGAVAEALRNRRMYRFYPSGVAGAQSYPAATYFAGERGWKYTMSA